MKNKGLITGLILSGAFILVSNDEARGQGNVLAFNGESGAKKEIKAPAKALEAPNLFEATSSYDAQLASDDAGIGFHIHHGKNDPISGYRYAKGLANGFADRERTRNKPIYTTGTHEQNATEGTTFVSVYIDGALWFYKGDDMLSPQTVAQLIPLIMEEYVKKHGRGKLIPENIEPVQIASLN